MSRLEELEKLVDKVKDEEIKLLIRPSIDQVIFLENQLDTIRTYPLIKIHPTNPTKQKVLPAQRIYISLLQQYNLLIKSLCKILSSSGAEDVSPLRAYLEGLKNR